jgi:hypothetical protein
MTFSKGPGYDWQITYKFDDEPIETMVVWGQIRIEDAILEARRSFDDEGQPLLVILQAERVGHMRHRLGQS